MARTCSRRPSDTGLSSEAVRHFNQMGVCLSSCPFFHESGSNCSSKQGRLGVKRTDSPPLAEQRNRVEKLKYRREHSQEVQSRNS